MSIYIYNDSGYFFPLWHKDRSLEEEQGDWNLIFMPFVIFQKIIQNHVASSLASKADHTVL